MDFCFIIFPFFIVEISIRKYLGIGVQWVSLVTENLLSHPFIVLRRQCQVYNASQRYIYFIIHKRKFSKFTLSLSLFLLLNRYHLHPFALIPSIVHLHKRQGVTTLWKGLGSCLMVRGMSMAMDDLLSKITTWPK